MLNTHFRRIEKLNETKFDQFTFRGFEYAKLGGIATSHNCNSMVKIQKIKKKLIQFKLI